MYTHILMCIYTYTHTYILHICVYTYTETAWMNCYKISSAKTSGYYFIDRWKNQTFSSCKDSRRCPWELYGLISLIYMCSHLDSHIFYNFDSHFLSPILLFEQLMCFATEVAHSCRIIFCPMALSSPSVSVVLLLSHTLFLSEGKKMEKEWS